VRRLDDALILTGAAIHVGGAEVLAEFAIFAVDGTVTFTMQAPAWALAVERGYFLAKPAGPSGAAGIGALRYRVFNGSAGGAVGVDGRFYPARPGDLAYGLTRARAGGGQAVST
jgi:hypothetical protein